MIVPCPFTFGFVTWQVSRRYEEKDDDDYEGGTEGDGAKAADRAMRVAGTGGGNDTSCDKGCLFGWAIVGHDCG